MIENYLKNLNAFISLILMCITCAFSSPALSQFVPQNSAPAQAQIPDKLDQDAIDPLLSRLTDHEIRELLRQELIRRSTEKTIPTDSGESFADRITTRLTELRVNVDKRLRRWIKAIANIVDRREAINKRLEQASNGIFGMLLAAFLLVAAGIAAAFIVSRLTSRWKSWLTEVVSPGYWERVLRTIAFGIVELLPIIAFIIATQIVTPPLSEWLGPLSGQVWIYSTGVWNGWLVLVLARRAFAPYNPQIRIATISDAAAVVVYAIVKRVVVFGVAGWVTAGFFPNLGFGFPPALLTVAATGTLIAAYLLFTIIYNRQAIGNFLKETILSDTNNKFFHRILFVGIQIFSCIYIIIAWAVWLAIWLEQGVHNLDGPIGTIIIALLIPLFERFGRELIGSVVASQSPMAMRVKNVLKDAWRALVALVSISFALSLWSVDILEIAKGENASVVASTLFDIVITILIGQLVWRLVGAALYTEKRNNAGSEDADPDAPGASRVETLIPVFRNILLGILAIIIALIVLSAIGIDVAPLIASAGIVGIAIGFGAQALVRDIFSGIFFLIDDAFRVGEYIELENMIKGEVESITIRSLQLRNHRGPVITIPFGELKQITNHSRDWVIYKMEFRLEPQTVPQQVKKVVKQVGAEFMEHPDHGPKFIEPLKSQGVKSIDDDSALIVRVKFKCLPRTQFVLRREIYHRLKIAFEENGIFFARRKIEVVGADGEPVEDKSKIAIPDELLEKPGQAKV